MRFSQGKFVPKNPQKYVGNRTPTYRSSWELHFMMFCDSNKNVLQWASEPIKIPYRHPLTGKSTVYVPDFLVVYENKYKKQIAEMIEIKPKKQSLLEGNTKNPRDIAAVVVNRAKWAAAQAYCKRSGLIFRVLNEGDLFKNTSNSKK